MDNEEEIWKDIEGYEGLYQISNFGRVKSLKRNILLRYGSCKGYHNVSLSKNGIIKTFTVHRLVAKHFISNPENKTIIDHIDTNIHNNNVKNLRWVTSKENCNNPITIKKQSIRMKGFRHSDASKEKIRQKAIGRKWSIEDKLKVSKKVICVETGTIYYSTKEAEKGNWNKEWKYK